MPLLEKLSSVEAMSSTLQPKLFYDGKGFPSKNSSPHPPFEKMKSCDYSVEVSSESSEDEESFPWATDKFAKQKEAGSKELLLVSLQDEPEEDRLEPKLLDIYDIDSNKKYCEWKLGALDQGRKQSPVESDDLTCTAPSSLKVAVETLWGLVPFQNSFFEEKKPCESEHSEGEKPSSTIIKKTEPKKRKEKGTPAEKSVLTPKKNKVSAEKKRVFKRHGIGKKKRNVYEIIVPDIDNKVKRKAKKVTRPKQKPKRSVSSANSFEIPSGYSCVDSGVSAGNSYSSNGGNQSGAYTNDGNGGSNCGGGGGGGGFHKKGGLGGHGGDDHDGKKPFSHVDVNMEEEDEENEDDDDDVKMVSKSGSDMDCHEGQESVHSAPWETFSFKTQHLQHGAYCRNDNCTRPLCHEMKREIQHIDSHKCNEKCHRCCKTLQLLKYHAANCKVPCCRVYLCNSLREKKDVAQEPVTAVPHAPVPTFIPIWNSQKDVDGTLVLNNTGLNLGTHFQENIDYIKNEKVGNGNNGHVYKVQFTPSSPLYNVPNQVVKETEYKISKEEVQVYKRIGDHPNILKHNLVSMKGSNGHASIFMEECDMSLKDKLFHNHRMEDKECMFYFHQVVDGVKHIHDKGVIHKDIKAQNILLSGLVGNGEHLRAKLADFDAAKILESEFTAGGLKPMGTRGFVSPEVMQCLPHGRPADIYSLGCLLLEMKGFTPNLDQLDVQREELGKISPYLGKIVELCVQKDPGKRPTAADMQQILQECNVTDALE